MVYPIAEVIIAPGHVDNLDVLVKHGADVDQVVLEKFQMSLLDYAINLGEVEMVQRLLNLGAEIQPKDKNDIPAFAFALHPGMALATRMEIMDILLKNGSEINVLDYSAAEYSLVFTPLMTALFWHAYASAEHKKDYKKVIFYLLDKGADINFRPPGSITAMHVAVVGDDMELVKRLVRSGGDADIVSSDGCWTPLLSATAFGRNMEIYDYLIEQGADLDHVCPIDGHSILDKITIRREETPVAGMDTVMKKSAGEKYTDSEWQAIGDKMLDSIAKHCRRGLKFNICDELREL